MDAQVDGVCLIDGLQFEIHDNSRYNRRNFLDEQLSGSSLSPARRVASNSTAGVRVTVE